MFELNFHLLQLTLCTYHLLPCGSTPGTPSGNPGGRVQFWYFFFPKGGGSCLVSKTTLLDHGDIPTGFARGSATGKVKSAYLVPWSMCENEQKACKKI